MFCAISGEPPQEPVVSAKSGFVYEKRLILKFIADGGKEPATGENLSEDDLINVKLNPKPIKPRPPTVNSVPSLLSLLQNEYDSIMLETYQLKQQHHQLRQELSNALYENDAAKRVIARLLKERDSARENLATISAATAQSGLSETAGNGVAVDASGDASNQMDVDGDANGDDESAIAGVNKEIAEKMDETAASLSKSRKKRKAPAGSATAEEISSYKAQSEIPSLHSTTNPGISAIDVLSLPSTDPTHIEKQSWVLTGGNDGTILLTDWKSGSQLASIKAHTAGKKVTSVSWIEQGPHAGNAFVSSSVDHTVKLWNVKEDGSVGRARHVVKGHSGEVSGVAVHPSGEFVVSASLDASWAFCDLEKGLQVSKTVHPEGKEAYSAVAIHPDGLISATGTTNSTVRIWELKSAKNVATFTDPDLVGNISSLSFSENGYYFATAAADSNVVKLWDLRKLACFHSLNVSGSDGFSGKGGVSKVAFDYGGVSLGVACGDAITIVRNKQWDELVKFVPSGSIVGDFKFGAYSKWLASSSLSDRKVIVTGV